MIRASVFAFLLSVALTAQSTDAPQKFIAADVHAAAKTNSPMSRFFRGSAVRAGRYEVIHASMLDLVRLAYGYQADKILGGPSWLEMDRFDVIGKLPPDSTTESQKQMLQSLLGERFKLMIHKETKPLPTFALTVGKKLQLRQPDKSSGQTGCRVEESSGAPGEGGIRLFSSGPDGKTTMLSLGPGGVLQYHCRNMTMASFAEGLPAMMGARGAVGDNPILDETGLKGAWDFDVKWSLGIIGPMMQQSDKISVGEALEKQLGLRLEPRQVPTPVLIVDSVNRKPTDNPPGLAEVLPPLIPPTEFEVADVRPSNPDAGGRGPGVPMMLGLRIQPGGRVSAQNTPMRLLLMRAFNSFNQDEIAGIPAWADRDRFDITAKAPASAQLTAADSELASPMLRSLLVERFGLKYHTEERPINGYALLSAKPKLKKADPQARSSCKTDQGGPGSAPGSLTMNCRNVTVAQFAEQLNAPGINSPILDATGIEGNWDITVTYSQRATMMAAGMGIGAGRGGPAADPNSVVPQGPDPEGGYTLFEALEKQLGLKLEQRKRSLPVTVIDHLDEKPTEN